VPRDEAHRVYSGPNTAIDDQTSIWGAYYVVTSVNSYGESGPSNTDRADVWCSGGYPIPTRTPTPTPTNTPTRTPTPTLTPTSGPPGAPANLQACIDTGGNRLTWSAVLGATSYRVYRHTSTPVPLDAWHRVVTILSGTVTWYLDSRGQPGNYYVVTALCDYGEIRWISAFSVRAGGRQALAREV
jgi:hypothetical protein